MLIKVDGSPGFAMKLPGTMKVRGELKEIRECWNLLMNTLEIGIEIEENMKREWIFKDKNTGGERTRLVHHFLVSIVEQKQVVVVSKKNQERGVKYKLNESWVKRVNKIREQRKEKNEKVECFRCREVGHRARDCKEVECYSCSQKEHIKREGLR